MISVTHRFQWANIYVYYIHRRDRKNARYRHRDTISNRIFGFDAELRPKIHSNLMMSCVNRQYDEVDFALFWRWFVPFSFYNIISISVQLFVMALGDAEWLGFFSHDEANAKANLCGVLTKYLIESLNWTIPYSGCAIPCWHLIDKSHFDYVSQGGTKSGPTQCSIIYLVDTKWYDELKNKSDKGTANKAEQNCIDGLKKQNSKIW